MSVSREMTQEEKAWHGTINIVSNIEKMLWHRGGRPENKDSMREDLHEMLDRLEQRCQILRKHVNGNSEAPQNENKS